MNRHGPSFDHFVGLRRTEIDFEKKVWTVPAARMKAAREHRVPLSARAFAIVKQLANDNDGDFLFQGRRRNKPLSNMAMDMVLRRMNQDEVTVHGFRSSFRDWAGNLSSFPRELAETALAHVIGDKAEQAYRRSDAVEKRRKLMDAWASYCEPRAAGSVVPIRRRISALRRWLPHRDSHSCHLCNTAARISPASGGRRGQAPEVCD